MLYKELLTVTAEKATKHSPANRQKNIPPSVGFSDSSISWIYLQESTVCYPKTNVWKVTQFISIHSFHVLHYILVVSYTAFELFQHPLRSRAISRTLHSVQFSVTDQRDIRPELLKLAAGYTYQGGV
jgi:hypothetical protein